MECVTIIRSDVPLYLHNSDFYRNLSEDEDEEFTLSVNHFKRNCLVGNVQQLDYLLSTLRFWGTADYPVEILQFAWNNPVSLYTSIFRDYWDELSYLKIIHTIMSAPRADAFNVAISTGNIKIYLFLRSCGCQFDRNSSRVAATAGILGILIDINFAGWLLTEEATEAAASNGHLHILQHYMQGHVSFLFHDRVCLAAARHNQSECLKFLYEYQSPNVELKMAICDRAARHGFVECYKLSFINTPRHARYCTTSGVVSGNIKCLKYAYAMNNNSWNFTTSMDVLNSDSVECVEFVLRKGGVFTQEHMMYAIQRGVLRIVQCLHNNNVPLYNFAHVAAERGHLSVLQYLHDHNVPWDTETITNAARNGHLDCIVYARANGCPWDGAACEAAAMNNHIHCLRYLHERDCPWDERTTHAALTYKAHDCMRYATERGCSISIKNTFWKGIRSLTSSSK